MENITNSINFDFALETFKGICELNNYTFTLSKDSQINKQYMYSTENKLFELCTHNNKNAYIEAELINIGVKYLEILGLEDTILKLNKENAPLEEILDNLEIDYTIDSTLDANSGELYFEILGFNDKNDEVKIAYGKNNEDNISLIIDFSNLNDVLLSNEIKFKKQDLDIVVLSENNTMMDAMIIGTNLKDLGFKTEIDTTEYKIEDKLKLNHNTNYLIVITEETMKKYSVKLIDAKTKEEKLVSINTLQDELFMNF